VKGTGERPDYFEHSKYKTLADQAKAYPEARAKFQELEGKVKAAGEAKAPPSEYKLPEFTDALAGLTWNKEDPLLGKAFEVAKKHKISQEAFDDFAKEMVGPLIMHYEMLDLEAEKAAMGPRADERMKWLDGWAKQNLSDEQYGLVSGLLTKWAQPRETFSALETLLAAATKQQSLRPGDDVTTGAASVVDWNAKWYAKSDMPGYKLKIDEPGARERARAELAKIAPGDHIEVIGKR